MSIPDRQVTPSPQAHESGSMKRAEVRKGWFCAVVGPGLCFWFDIGSGARAAVPGVSGGSSYRLSGLLGVRGCFP